MNEKTKFRFSSNQISLVLALLFTLIFFFLLVFPTTIVHEFGHLLVCRLFGIPTFISYMSPLKIRIDYQSPPNPYVNVAIGLSGGLASTVFAILLFLLAQKLRVGSQAGKIPYSEIRAGFMVSALSIVLKESTTAFLEGLFRYQYLALIHSIFWDVFTTCAPILCFALVMWRWRWRI